MFKISAATLLFAVVFLSLANTANSQIVSPMAPPPVSPPIGVLPPGSTFPINTPVNNPVNAPIGVGAYIPVQCTQCNLITPQISTCVASAPLYRHRYYENHCVCRFAKTRELSGCMKCLKEFNSPLYLVYRDFRTGCIARQPAIMSRGVTTMATIQGALPFGFMAGPNFWFNAAKTTVFSGALAIAALWLLV